MALSSNPSTSDIDSLLSALQAASASPSPGSFPSNGAYLFQRLQSHSAPCQMAPSVGGDPAALTALSQNVAGAIQQQQQQYQQNIGTDFLSLHTFQQVRHVTNNQDQALNFARLAGANMSPNLGSQPQGQMRVTPSQNSSATQGTRPQSGSVAERISAPLQQHFTSLAGTNLASRVAAQQLSQTTQASTQAQSLALARLAGARLLSDSQHSNRSKQGHNGIVAPKPLLTSKLRSQGALRGEKKKLVPSNNARPSARVSPTRLVLNKTYSVGAENGDGSTRFRNLVPGAIAVPCRARGMPMDHNPLTAYFVITDDTSHGNDVVCSHPSCRDAGVKFRYCSFCKAPVGKTNFSMRHNHASSQPEDYDESTKYSTASAVKSRRSTAHKHKTSADAVKGSEAKRARG